MAKELYLYQGIYSFTAERLISELEANSREDISLRIMSPGGSVFAGWDIIAKIQEKKEGKITMKVGAAVMSMATHLLLWGDKVVALNVSNILLHRAAGPVSSQADQEFLDKINMDLRKQMEKRINNQKLMEIKKVGIADLFDRPDRIDLMLTAQEAKDIGLVHEIIELTPKEFEAEASAFHKHFDIAADGTNPQTPSTMTLEEIKAKHPELYNQIIALGVTKGIDIAKAWARYSDVDPVAVAKGIETGKEITMDQALEFIEKRANAKVLGKLKAEAEGNQTEGGTTAEADKVKLAAEAKKKESEEFFNNVNAQTGVKIFQ